VKQRVKTALVICVLVLTAGAFSYYIKKHPEVITRLGDISPLILVALLGVYTLSFLAYVVITRLSLQLFSKTLSKQENLLFNAYSSLINFFGPGQSGPAFRAVYLKKRHNLSLKRYALTALIYYGFFAVISVALAFAGSRPWWQTMLLAVLVAIASIVFIRRYREKLGAGGHIHTKLIGLIGIMTAVQILMQIFIFAIELHSVTSHVSWGQIFSYTGVANLSLFVAITPGGIGIREAFLLFSTQLHHISSSTVVAASVIDRGVYILFLGILFVLVVTMHAKDKLYIATSKEQSTK
jgi:uncharacterized membrane protein YbhN (UPF0104 family)